MRFLDSDCGELFVARAILEPSQRYSLEQLGVIGITGISFVAPLALAEFLDYRAVPEGTKVPAEEIESLLDFLDKRDDLKVVSVNIVCATSTEASDTHRAKDP